jgi:hypothetical protein
MPNVTATRFKAWHAAGVLFAISYLALSAWILAHPSEGSWSGFVVFMLGWPLTLPGLLTSRVTGMGGMLAFGALQWFLVGGGLFAGIRKMFAAVRANAGA